MQVETFNLSENIISLKLDNISYFALFSIINGNQIISYKYKFNNELYFPNDISSEIINNVSELTSLGLHFFNQIVSAEIQLTKNSLPSITSKLIQENVQELTEIANELGFLKNQEIYKEEIYSTDFYRSISPLAILDIDKSFKNKILFYYLFNKSTASREEITEKAELVTMEKQEQIFEQIFQNGIANSLPETINKHPFCTLQATLTYSELLQLQNLLQPTFFIQTLNYKYNFETPASIINSSNHELWLTTIEQLKKIGSQYLIPFCFKQNAVFSVNFKQYEALKKDKSTISQSVVEIIQNNFNFFR